jgi:predicted neutral ceramidase superfamily lipid hydrolase
MNVKSTLRRAAAPLALVMAAVAPSAAFAQTANPANFDQTKIVDAVNTGLANGIAVLLAIAPIVIAFAVVWMIIKKGKGMASS